MRPPIDPGNLSDRRGSLLTLNPNPPDWSAAAATVHRHALDPADEAELLAMLGLDQQPEQIRPLYWPQVGKERK